MNIDRNEHTDFLSIAVKGYLEYFQSALEVWCVGKVVAENGDPGAGLGPHVAESVVDEGGDAGRHAAVQRAVGTEPSLAAQAFSYS